MAEARLRRNREELVTDLHLGLFWKREVLLHALNGGVYRRFGDAVVLDFWNEWLSIPTR